MLHRFRKLLGWLGSHPPQVLAAALAVVLGTWGFIALADEVTEGETQRFDEWAVRSLRKPDNPAEALGPRWSRSRAATSRPRRRGVLFMVTAGVTVYLIVSAVPRDVAGYRRHDRRVLHQLGLEIRLRRERRASCLTCRTSTLKLPQRHSMLSAVVYLTSAYCLPASSPSGC